MNMRDMINKLMTFSPSFQGPLPGMVRGGDFLLKSDVLDVAYTLQREIDDANREAVHWRANHDNQVQRARVLMDRPDLPLERVQAYEMIKVLQIEAARYRWLRDGNAYAPEESLVRGGDELDALCDAGILESQSKSWPK